MTFTPKITHTFPNGAVNVELTLTFSTGGPLVAEDIAEKMLEELLRLAGTRNVPAIPLTPEEWGENDDSPEEREMTRQGVGDFACGERSRAGTTCKLPVGHAGGHRALIDPGDVELLEAAGVPEFPETNEGDEYAKVDGNDR